MKIKYSDFSRNPPVLGFNQNTIWTPSWTDSSFMSSVKKISPQLMRYPGGNHSAFFNWRTGKVLEKKSLSTKQITSKSKLRDRVYRNKSRVSHDLIELKKGVDSIGFKPVFCLNVVSSNLPEQLEMLREARRLGIPVQYIELGNEICFKDRIYMSKYPTPLDYAMEMESWCREIKLEFPNAKIAAVGSLKDYKNFNDRRDVWNNAVISKVNNADALTLHIYPKYEDYNNDINKVDNLLRLLEAMPTEETIPQGMEIWVTEYNIFNKQTKEIWTTWLHGLFVSLQTFKIMENEDIKMLLNHSILSGGDAISALSTLKGKKNKLTPVGLNLSFIFPLVAEADLIKKMDIFLDDTKIENTAYSAWVIEKEGIKSLIVVNFSNSKIDLDMNEVFQNEILFKQFFMNNENILQKNITEENVLIETGKNSGPLSIKPFSISVIKE